MSTLHVTLRCLKHPATLFSIGLLLANDHWLKASIPSWWTGKLSDFAGLFFFPFLLAPLIALILDRKNASPITAGGLAFGLTAIWFALLKTLPLANAATSALLAVVLGHPVQLVLDPTDLIALPVLVPAWLLWVHETQAGEDKPSKRAWLALALGVLATAATSPAPPFYIIQRLEEEGGKLYAYGSSSYYDRPGSSVPSYESRPLAFSRDGGRTWDFVPSSTAAPASSEEPTRQACDPGNAQVCYRILPEQVEASHDGGKTHQTAWSIPWGRRFFMERESRGSGPMARAKPIDMGPYDLILTPPVGANGLSTVVVAMGNEGVLVRTPDGQWNRYAVWTAQPTPFTASSVFDVFGTVSVETDIAAFLVLLSFSLLSFRTASTFKKLGGSSHSVAWAIWPLVAVDVLLLIAWCVFAWNGFYRIGPFLIFGILSLYNLAVPISPNFLVPLIFMILPISLLVWTWKRIAQLHPGSGVALATFWRIVRVCIGLALGAVGPLVLWTIGVIPMYELAVALAVVLGLVVVRLGIKSKGEAFF
jgi:hypothetical protein